MKKFLASFGIGLLYYIVFRMVLSTVFEGKIIGTSNTIFIFSLINWCCMWLCLFTACIRIFEDIINEKLFGGNIERYIRKIALHHAHLIRKYDRPDLFADELMKKVKEKGEVMKEEKDD